MIESFRCPECEQKLIADKESWLVQMVKEHYRVQHGAEMDEDEIRRDIEAANRGNSL